MPEGNINALIQAFVAAARRERYSKVMEGIGHVAVAVSYAEFIVDSIGGVLTGELEAYSALTKGMSLGPKADHVKVMSKSLIMDNDLRDIAIRFCSDLKKDIRQAKRCRTFSLRTCSGRRSTHRYPNPTPRHRNVSAVFELAAQIYKLATESKSLPEQLELEGQRRHLAR